MPGCACFSFFSPNLLWRAIDTYVSTWLIFWLIDLESLLMFISTCRWTVVILLIKKYSMLDFAQLKDIHRSINFDWEELCMEAINYYFLQKNKRVFVLVMGLKFRKGSLFLQGVFIFVGGLPSLVSTLPYWQVNKVSIYLQRSRYLIPANSEALCTSLMPVDLKWGSHECRLISHG